MTTFHFFTRVQAWQLHEILLDHVRAWALASRGLFLRPAAAAAAEEGEGPPEYVRYTAGLPDSEIRWAQVQLACRPATGEVISVVDARPNKRTRKSSRNVRVGWGGWVENGPG